MIAIVDCGVGNLRSLANALRTAGFRPEVLDRPPSAPPEAVLLPGVGAFGAAASEIRRRGWEEYLRGFAGDGGRLIGICLGMQLLFESSEESPGARGLGLLKGRVHALRGPKIPHIGWARLRFASGSAALPWAYFAHSFVAEPGEGEVAAWAAYGEEFPAVVRRGNVVGVQFHPEKSQGPGVAFLKNLLDGRI